MNATFSKNAMDIFKNNASDRWNKALPVKKMAWILDVSEHKVWEMIKSSEVAMVSDPAETNRYRIDLDSILGYFERSPKLRMYYYQLAQWIFAEHMKKAEATWTK